MKKLHSLAFYALVTSIITLGSGAFFVAQASDETADLEKQSMGYMKSPPANSMMASDLIGTDLKASGGESVGEISDLIIDQDGKVGAFLVNVGGFLAMGEKRIAIDWNAVTMSGNTGDQDPQVDMTRDDLQSAPSYERLDDRRPKPPTDLRVE